MKFKYEIMQALLCFIFAMHLILGVFIIIIILENRLSLLMDCIICICWISMLVVASVINHKLDDKIKEDYINNLNKQMKK